MVYNGKTWACGPRPTILAGKKGEKRKFKKKVGVKVTMTIKRKHSH